MIDKHVEWVTYREMERRAKSRKIMDTAKRIRDERKITWLQAVRLSLEENGVFESGRMVER
jgi:hypothetical protein